MRQKCVLSGQLANNPAAALFRCFWVPCVQCALFGMLESIRILHWSYQCFMPLCGSAIWKGEEPWHDLLLSQTHHQRWSNIPFWIRSMSIPFILRLSLSLACFAPYQDWLTDYIILYIYIYAPYQSIPHRHGPHGFADRAIVLQLVLPMGRTHRCGLDVACYQAMENPPIFNR